MPSPSRFAKRAWTMGALSPDDEARLMSRWPGLLTTFDHDTRMERLLANRSTSLATRLLPMTTVSRQPVYSARVLDELLEKTAPFGVPVLVGILPLVSERNAEFLHNEVPGITLPEAVRERMRGKQGEAGVRGTAAA